MSELTKSLIECLGNNGQYTSAIFTTYNFDIDFFERNIFSQLLYAKCKKVFVYVDGGQLTESLKRCSKNARLGRDYCVQPININGSFHPKMILLVGEKNLRLVVGSANLTHSGYKTNREIFQTFDYSENNTEYGSIFKSAIQFIKSLSNDYNDFDVDINKECLDAADRLLGNYESDNTWLITNYNCSLLPQVTGIIKESITQIDIAVPFYDSNISVIQELKRKYPEAKINLFVQNLYSTFPKDQINSEVINSLFVFGGVLKESQSHFYHGKVFRFISNDCSYVLYGSANCTASAMLSGKNGGGNIEMSILTKGSKEEYDAFFESFKIYNYFEKNNLVSCQYPSIDSRVSNIRFIKGIIDENYAFVDIEIHNNNEKPCFMLDNDDCEIVSYKEESGVYVVKCPLKNINCTILELTVTFDDVEETILCWCYSQVCIDTVWNRISSNTLDRYDEFLSVGKDYTEQQRILVNLIQENLSILNPSSDNIQIIDLPDDEPDNNDDEDDEVVGGVSVTFASEDDQKTLDRIYKSLQNNWLKLTPVKIDTKTSCGGGHTSISTPSTGSDKTYDSNKYFNFLVDSLRRLLDSKELEPASLRTLLFVYSLIDNDLFKCCFKESKNNFKIRSLQKEFLEYAFVHHITEEFNELENIEKEQFAILLVKNIFDLYDSKGFDKFLTHKKIEDSFKKIEEFYPIVDVIDLITEVVSLTYSFDLIFDDVKRFIKRHLPYLSREEFKRTFEKVVTNSKYHDCEVDNPQIVDNTIEVNVLTDNIIHCLSLDRNSFGDVDLAKIIIDYTNHKNMTSFSKENCNIVVRFTSLDSKNPLQSVLYTKCGVDVKQYRHYFDGSSAVEPKSIF